MKLAAIILAAGASRRFGSDKLLHAVDDRSLLNRCLDAIPPGHFRQIVVVTTSARRKFLDDRTLQVIVSDNGEMSDSLRAGFAALTDDIEGALIHLADMPDVAREDVSRICSAFISSDGNRVVVPVHERRGNPVLLPRRLFPAINRLAGDVGACKLIEREDCIEVQCSAGVCRDIDRPEDL